MRPSYQRHKRARRLGRYELLEELRRDGDGSIVYKARDPLLARLVAIETVARQAAASAPADPAFERKARLAAGLAHPNIITVYDTGTTRDVAFIATELVDGQTLRNMLDSGIAPSPAMIERIAAQVADGLDYMHVHAIVHGDVTPSALIVLDIGFVKIACLGDALFPMGCPMSGERTPAPSPYMSPERAMGGAIDARSDVFSLGVVLYEMLTGSAPFCGSTAAELVDAITNQHPRPPSVLNPGIPTGFDYIVARALSKEPDHRYPTARDMAADLRRWALEDSTFFAAPRSAATILQTLRARSPGIATPAELAAAGAVPDDAASEPKAARPPHLRTRRQWLMYGVPGALLAMTGAWAMWSRPRTTLEPGTASATAARAMMPTPAAGESVEVVTESPPPVAQAKTEPLNGAPAVTEPIRARADARLMARVSLAVSPWGEIYVNGRRRGVAPPLRHIELAPGRYRIDIKNTKFPPRSEYVEAKANARLRIKHKFT